MHPHRNYPRQPVGWGTFTEAPPPVVAPYVEARPADWLLLAVLRPAWAYRLELALIVLLATVTMPAARPRATKSRSSTENAWAALRSGPLV